MPEILYKEQRKEKCKSKNYYSLYILIKREKISFSILKNGWMWGMAVMFVIGDKALFIANGMEGSRITIMTIVKQFGCIITILGGKIFFNERNTSYRLFCALVIIMGILFGILVINLEFSRYYYFLGLWGIFYLFIYISSFFFIKFF